MKKFMAEFKEFAVKGNMIDMAIGVIIGGAFTALVTAFTTNIVNPLIALIPGVNSLDNALKIVLKEAELSPAGEVVAEEVAIKFGAFISAIITFLILALIIFMIVKGINKMRKMEEERKAAEAPAEEPAEPTTKICPFCQSEIPILARRCPHCTSQLEE
ncbi:MAG: large conductance mechanosensitive channel protein MscL [Lachnospiraceae bacterium]|jgi:large conductance mechanosensitive channel|nr:large conductance mechanosensitive channel protein MscL [Lachnospiraceae bacterium]